MTLTFHDLFNALARAVHAFHPVPPTPTDRTEASDDENPRPEAPYWTCFIENPIPKDSK